MNSYNDIIGIDAEISGYRRPCLRASILLNKGMVAWNDSLQWNNNFLRSITADCRQEIVGLLPSTKLLQWAPIYEVADESGVNRRGSLSEAWSVTVTFTDGTVFRSAGSKVYPEDWPAFRKLVEVATRIPFRIR